MPDTPLISAVPDGRDHALEIARDYIETKDDGVVAPYVRGLTDFTA